MSLSRQLAQRAAEGRPIRIGLVGAGKFGTMFLSQLPLTTEMRLTALSDLVPGRATERLTGVQSPADRIDARSIDEAIRTGKSSITDDAMAVIGHPQIDVIIEATGNPATGYARNCAVEYDLLPDESGRYAALYRPTQMIGLELGQSVASAVLRSEPTGSAYRFRREMERQFPRPEPS